MKRRQILAASAATLLSLSAGTVAAQDWNGPYVGVSLGGDMVKDDSDELTLFDTDLNGTFGDTVRTSMGADAFSSSMTTPAGFCGGAAVARNFAAGCYDDDQTTFNAGLRAGYDIEFGGFVVGVVGEVSGVGVEDNVTGFSTTPASYQFSREIDDPVLSARLRAGVPFGRVMPYVTGGYAVTNVEERYTTTNAANSFSPIVSSSNADGYQAGAGIDYQMEDGVSFGLEYLFTELSVDDPLVTHVGPGTAPATNPFLLVNAAGTDNRRESDDISYHSVRVTLSKRF